jgi:hypothetical protein
MYRFSAAFMGLISSFFTWHCFNFFLYKIISLNYQSGHHPR